MTGFGRASVDGETLAVDVETRSVNGKFLSVRCRLPSDYGYLEPRVEAAVRRVVRRGSVDVNVRLRGAPPERRPLVNEDALATYRGAIERCGEPDESPPSTVALLALPGVVSLEEPGRGPTRSVERVVVRAVGASLEKLGEAQLSEGTRVARALRRELDAMRREIAAVRKRLPQVVRRHHAALRRRVSSLLDGAPLPSDDPTLLREVAVLADRLDVTEEIDRLQSHLEELGAALEADGPVGRKLEFLVQEVGRELNTLGGKCNDAALVRRVISLKQRAERLREQAANVA